MGRDEPVGMFPSKAEFSVSPYSDGSGCRVRIAYNSADSDPWANEIRIGDDYGISFPYEDAEAVIEAIRFCAAALRALAEKQP